MSIDASLRRAINRARDRGHVIPDSKPIKAEIPQLIMTPGIVRPVFKFEDGDGLTDAFGNIYEGYGGAGGDSFVHKHSPAQSVDAEVDDTSNDGDLLQYDASREKYVSKSIDDAGVSKELISDFISVVIENPANKSYKIVNNSPYTLNISSFTSEFGTGTGTVTLSTGPSPSVLGIGQDLLVTVAGVSDPVADLTVMIFFTRNLNEI